MQHLCISLDNYETEVAFYVLPFIYHQAYILFGYSIDNREKIHMYTINFGIQCKGAQVYVESSNNNGKCFRDIEFVYHPTVNYEIK